MAAAFLKVPSAVQEPWKPGCSGKRGYTGKNFAIMVAKKWKVEHAPYRCKFCKKWHITSKGKIGK